MARVSADPTWQEHQQCPAGGCFSLQNFKDKPSAHLRLQNQRFGEERCQELKTPLTLQLGTPVPRSELRTSFPVSDQVPHL